MRGIEVNGYERKGVLYFGVISDLCGEGPVINVEDAMQLCGKSSLGRGSSKCSAKMLEKTIAGCFCVQVTRTVGLEQNEQGEIGRK